MKKIGRYEIKGNLGEGGMGIVYKAHDPLMKREVAVKVLLERAFEHEEMRERFYREAQSAGKLLHDNITIVHDLGEYEGKPFIVMEYVPGTDLREIIREERELSLEQKINYAIQICKGLAFSHSKGIIHRDIKPENIRITDDGKVKVMDFGIARPVTSTMTMTGTVMGTPHYMSPEQIKGVKVEGPSDIWSFGVVLYELLTYQLPFPGDNPTSVSYKIVHESPAPFDNKEVLSSKNLSNIISKALEKEPANRYGTFNEIVEDLGKATRELQSETSKAANERRKKIDRLIASARKHLTRNNFTRARKFARQAAEIDPEATTELQIEEEIRRAEKRETQAKPGIQEAETILIEPNRETEILVPDKPARSKPSFRLPPWNDKKMIIAGSLIAVVLLIFAYRIFVPSSPTAIAGMGYVALNVQPWAEVVKITNNQGDDIEGLTSDDERLLTPARLQLPQGEYTLFLENPNLSSLEIPVTVRAGEVQRVERQMPGFDIETVLSNFKSTH